MSENIPKPKFAVFASGRGSNLEAIIKKVQSGYIPADLVVVITDVKNAKARELARKNNIDEIYISRKEISREEHEKQILEVMREYKIDFIVLAGYMRILKHSLLKSYIDKIINIHPSILPTFPGGRGYEDTFNAKCQEGGCTIHFIDEGADTGPIITQAKVPIFKNDTLETFKERGLKKEHEVYPWVIKEYAEGKIKIYEENGKRKAKIRY